MASRKNGAPRKNKTGTLASGLPTTSQVFFTVIARTPPL